MFDPVPRYDFTAVLSQFDIILIRDCVNSIYAHENVIIAYYRVFQQNAS